MVKIAIEATGSDAGFESVLAGAKQAYLKNPDLELILVAGEDKLGNYDSRDLNGIGLVKTKNTYDSGQNGKERLESSIFGGMGLVKGGEVSAIIAPGDTRGAVYSACKVLGLIPGVLSPAIPTHWPVNNVLIDSGASPEATPENLYQFAIMGSIFSEHYLGVKNPLVGILTNGEESKKGNRFVRESRRLIRGLQKEGYNISGKYFEGGWFKDFGSGKVCVTDGHTGNIVLKTAEEAVKFVLSKFKEAVMEEPWHLKLCAKFGMKRPVKKLKEISYKQYATAPLLGVDGNVMICHGKSDEKAISNAISIALEYVKCNVNDHLKKAIESYGKPL